MDERFGAQYAAWMSRDQVIGSLGSRTVEQAIEAGLDTKRIWRAVCETFEVPVKDR